MLYGFELTIPSVWKPHEDAPSTHNDEEYILDRKQQMEDHLERIRNTSTANTRQNQIRQKQ